MGGKVGRGNLEGTSWGCTKVGRQKWGRGLGREARRAEWPILGGGRRVEGIGSLEEGERDVPTCSKIWKGVGREGVGERELGRRKRGWRARVRREVGRTKEGGPTDGGRGLVGVNKSPLGLGQFGQHLLMSGHLNPKFGGQWTVPTLGFAQVGRPNFSPKAISLPTGWFPQLGAGARVGLRRERELDVT